MTGQEVFARVLADAVRSSVIFVLLALIVAGVGSVFRWVLTVGFWLFVAVAGVSALQTILTTVLGVITLVTSLFVRGQPDRKADNVWLALGTLIRILEVGVDVALGLFLWSRWSGG